MKKRNKGVTLIALVVTIIVLLILAGVSIRLLFGNGGMIDRARQARFNTTIRALEENATLQRLEDQDLNKENEEVIRNDGEVTKEEKDNIISNIPTLNQTVMDLNQGQTVYDRPLYWYAKEDTEDYYKHEYIIDMETLTVYDYTGDEFLGKIWHTLDVGYDLGNEGEGGDEGEELPEGYIRLYLQYPEGSTNRQWRLGSPGELRDNPSLMWQDYGEGPIVIPITRTQDVWIRYNLGEEEVTVAPPGQIVVDIRQEPVQEDGKTKKVKIDIKYEEGSTDQQYKIGNSEWMDYTGPFEVYENCIIEAKAKKMVDIKTSTGEVIGQAEVKGSDKVQINSFTEDQPEDESLPAPTLQQLSPTGNEKARVEITYPEQATGDKVYRVNSGVELKYTQTLLINEWGNTITAYYYTEDGKKSPEASITIKKQASKLDVDIYVSPDPGVVRDAQTVKVAISYDGNATTKQYKIDNGNWQNYTEPFEISEDCVITAQARNQDGGNGVATSTIKFAEPTRPVISESLDSSKKKATISITYDEIAEKKQYRIGNGELQDYTGPFEVTENTTIYAIATTKKGKTAESTKEIRDIVKIEKPSIQYQLSEDKKKATVTIQYDDINAVTKQYKIGNGALQNYVGPFEVTEDTTIYAINTDSEGNSADAQSNVTGIIPIQKPEISYELSADKRKATVTIQYDEIATSKQYKIGNEVLQDYTGPFEVTENTTIYAVNNDGKGHSAEASKSITGISKLQAPKISYQLSQDKKKATVTIQYDETATRKQYKIGDGPLQDYTEPFEVTENNTVIYAESEDALQAVTNAETTITGIIPIQKPEITYQLSEDNAKATVTIQYDETATRKQYKIGEGDLQDYTGPFEVTENTTIYAINTDANENSADATATISGISEKLEVNIIANPDTEDIVESVEVSIEYDEKATIKQYSINGNTLQDYTGPFQVTTKSTIRAIAKNDGNGYGEAVKNITNLPQGVTAPKIKDTRTTEDEGDIANITIEYDENTTIKKYAINSNPIQDYTNGFAVRENGTVITAYASDNFGNTAQSTYTVNNLRRYTLIDQGKYYQIKLNYPEGSTNREYKYKSTGEWKEYKEDGFILVKSEYEDELIQNGELIKIEVEPGRYVDFTGHWYIFDGNVFTMVEDIYMRWDDGQSKPIRTPVQIIPVQTEYTDRVDVIILYPTTAIKKQYKVNDGEWLDYTQQLVVTTAGTTITARAQYEDGTWSDEVSVTINNIYPDNLVEIKTPEDLDAIRNNVNGNFIIKNEIDLSEYENWIPIPGFTGKLFGDKNTISNLTITSGTNVGLFETLGATAEVHDITFENVNINTATLSGAVAGTTQSGSLVKGIKVTGNISTTYTAGGIVSNNNGTIENCTVEAEINADSAVSKAGGIVATNYGKIKGCYVKGKVKSINGSSATYAGHAGGIAGNCNSGSEIIECINESEVTGEHIAGGIVGNVIDATKITKCYNIGKVKQTARWGAYIGGIVGSSSPDNNVTINDCFNIGKLEGTKFVGGIVASANNKVTIENSYNVGKINSTAGSKGAILATGNASIANAYYITEGCIVNTTYGDKGTELETYEEGTKQANYAGFDFETIWEIQEGKSMPYLKGMAVPEKVIIENIDTKFQGEGKGTEEDPYQIKTAEDMNNVRKSPTTNFKIMNEIDLSEYENWEPIQNFTGKLMGEGNKVSNLTITSGSNVGLFESLGETAEVEDIIFENVNITGSTGYTGTVAGQTENGSIIKGIKVTGNIGSGNRVGGIVGNSSGKIVGAITKGKVTTTYTSTSYIGGIIGYSNNANSEITECINESEVIGKYYVGGIIGYGNGSVTKSYNEGRIKIESTASSTYVGGIVGYIYRTNVTTVEDCYNIGEIEGNKYAGGIVGYPGAKTTINNNYNAGKITSTAGNAGAIVGTTYSGFVLTNAYYITEGSIVQGEGTEIATYEEGTKQAIYTGFDFDTIWEIQEGKSMPYLKGMVVPEKVIIENIDTKFQGEGKGTEEDPYQIKTKEDLKNIEKSLSACFKLMNDIDLQEEENWEPIQNFTGKLRGKGNRISNLTITSGTNVGLFESLGATAEVDDIIFENVNITGSTGYTGTVAGQTENGSIIKGIKVTGNISSGSHVGGIVGYNQGTIENCSVDMEISGTRQYTGGIAGQASGKIVGAITKGKVTTSYTSTSYVGGIAGYSDSNSEIIECINESEVIGKNCAGGIIGYGSGSGNIKKTYNEGKIKSQSYVGGIVGQLPSSTTMTIENCYNIGEVEGDQYTGGIVGFPNSRTTIKNTYNAGKITSTAAAAGGITGVAATTSKLTNAYYVAEGSLVQRNENGREIATYEEGTKQANYEGFDFDTIWEIQEGKSMPYLKGMTIPEKVVIENIDTKFQGEGKGTEEDPYLIKTAEDMNNIRKSPSANFKIMNEIDLSEYENWEPIQNFRGKLIGEGNKITNLTITSGTNVGLFETLGANAEVHDITFENVNIKGSTGYTGTVAGQAESESIVQRIKVTGNISSGNYAGGILGDTQGTIENCSVDMEITGSGQYAGGIAGQTTGESAKIVGSITKGKVTTSYTSTSYVGGIAGNNSHVNSEIIECINESEVTGKYYAGGIIAIGNGNITKSYNTGKIVLNSTGKNTYVGGIVGAVNSVIKIENCYNIGEIEGNQYAGGIIGYRNSATTTTTTTIINSYNAGKVISTAGSAGAIAGATYSGVVLTNVYYITEGSVVQGTYGTEIATYEEGAKQANYAGFDFDTIWEIQEGKTMPYLKGMTIPDQVYLSNH